MELAIPKLRQGSFFPVILERRRRIDQALYAVVMEAWVNGVSTRAVDDLVAALGIGSGISKSEVSRICAGLDEQVAAFRTRPCTTPRFPTCSSTPPTCTSAAAGQVTSMAVVVATGVTATGGREILGRRRRRLRGRGVLARVPAHPARTRPVRGAAGHLRPTLRSGRRPTAPAPGRARISVAGSTSPATCSPWCRSPTRTWSPRCSGPRSPNPTPPPSPRPGTRSATNSPRSFPKIGPLMDEAKAEVLAFTALPPPALDQDLVDQPDIG